MAILRNVVKILLVASLCTQGARAIDLGTNQSSHDVCDTHCTVEDLSKVKTLFETEVTKNQQRTVNLTISNGIYKNNVELVCQNLTPAVEVISSSYLMWADDEREPYLYLPPDFLSFAEKFSLHFGKKMNIRMNCTRKIRKAPPREHNGVSLSDAVTRCLIQDLMPTTGGTLCSPLESQYDNGISYKCCQLNNSEITCDVVHSSKYGQWFQILSVLWVVLGILVLPWYFPAIICLFPVYPRFSEEGIRCIVLRDSSPAGFGSLMVKAFVPPNKASPRLNKARFFILRAVLIPGVIVAVILNSSSLVLQLDIYTLLLRICVVLCCVNLINSIISTFSAPAQQGECKLCEFLFSEEVEHSDIGDQMKVHMFAQLSGYVTICRRFTLSYLNLFKSHVYFQLRFQSPRSALWSIFRIFYFVFHFSLVIPLLVVVYALTLYMAIILFSPFYNIVRWEIPFLLKCMANSVCGRNCMIRMYMYFILVPFTIGALIITGIFTSLLPMSFMTLIDDADAVFPSLALLLLTLYYICSCFTSFSAKYQLLKIKLHQGVQKFAARGNDESNHSLLLYTKSGAIAIPEDLFEAACRELQMSMMRNFSVALWQMVCLLIFVFSIFASIMTLGARLGITPLVQIVAIFLAGSFPKIFSLFSSREGDQKLKEIDMEMRLESVIARYAAQGQLRMQRDGIDGDRNNITLTPRNTRNYGSISCTSIPIATND